ncbi:uncharacterized protein MELLADRAFT_90254 [Melampsora larici-populina 98AG31]|uniref:Uncharacterized protein n=1 Tax=Melampsora larici-populina (strain 98AG31 / pathotype 3-4-7) TaxID=747676 RepID=F4RWA0_MELLP|nr:uncharacterized protein MELLADRAFT_90254 [Melampsora larici-populina 98AG31]EGG03247.1 hypothetical protein MELLADRAFT_90254 [Melampsora larici-populina 98AG31]
MISTVPSDPQWKCLVCQRQMRSYGPHSQTETHLAAVARYEARITAENVMLPGLNDPQNGNPAAPLPQDDIFNDNDELAPPDDLPFARPPSPFSYLQALQMAEENKTSETDDSDLEINIHKLAEAMAAMNEGFDSDDDEADEVALEHEMHTPQVQDAHEWYPFKKKEVRSISNVIQLLLFSNHY